MSLKTLIQTTILATSLMAPITSLASDASTIKVYKSPSCGCCTAWGDALEKAGYKVENHNIDDLDWAKQQFSVPDSMQGCHTAIIDGYVVEGHVPLEALAKLLSERPNIRGIATPGMPMGSLGMGYDPKARYTVYAFGLPDKKEPQPFYQAGQ